MILFLFPLFLPSAILIGAAVVPALALLYYVYRSDRVEKEPTALLVRLLVMGVIATAAAKLLEYAGMLLLDAFLQRESYLYLALLYIGVVGFAEEGAKYALLKRATWRAPDFNCRFDGVVYAVFVSLGFALWENIGYVMSYGIGTALIRALTAVPGHACFGVFMGCCYGQARALSNLGDEAGSKATLRLAVVIPALLHGVYDFLAAASGSLSPWFFVLFVLAMFAYTFRLVRRLSQSDRYI